MRIVYAILCLMMLSFIAVQYNDPDGLLWMAIYLVPAAWAGIAAWQPGWMARTGPRLLLTACVVLAVMGTVYFWPRSEAWWQIEIWYDVETAREGMGMMIVTGVLLLVTLTTRRKAA